MTSALRQKYFIAAFVQSVHSALDRNGIDLVLKVPEQDYDPSAQSHHLRRLLERRRGDLGAFCRKVRLPVVFTDIEPFAEESAYPENAAFVGYDTGALGELAGRWLVTRLRGIASREHRARQERCAEAVRLGWPNVSITVDERQLRPVPGRPGGGVLEAKALIDTADSPLRATVEQDHHTMATCVVDVLEKMRRGEPVASRHFLDAEVYEGPWIILVIE